MENTLDFPPSLIETYNAIQNIATCALYINTHLSIASVQQDDHPVVIVYYGGTALSVNKASFKLFRIDII